MTSHPEKSIVIDPDFGPTELRYVFDPEERLKGMTDECMAFLAYQRYYRASPVAKRPATTEMTHAKDAFRRSLDSFRFAVTHPADPYASEVLRHIAQEAESDIQPILREHGIQPGIFGNYAKFIKKQEKKPCDCKCFRI